MFIFNFQRVKSYIVYLPAKQGFILFLFEKIFSTFTLHFVKFRKQLEWQVAGSRVLLSSATGKQRSLSSGIKFILHF